MKMVLEKEVDGITVRDLSRISRDTSSFLLFEKFMMENGAKLIDPQFGVIDFPKSVMTVHERKERK
jgi:DNA invertase Pin-like site-specific DNA recombinase